MNSPRRLIDHATCDDDAGARPLASRRFPILTAKIIAALPPHDAPAISLAEIHAAVEIGVSVSIRNSLLLLERDGIAARVIDGTPGRAGHPLRRYRRART